MAELVTKVSVFVGSPGDVKAERGIIKEAVDDLNVTFGPRGKLYIELKTWETHVWPGFGDDAQDVITSRIGDYAIFVGVFWNRFGTPTQRAGSGSVEEFQIAYDKWKKTKSPALLLYFRRTPSELSTLDELDQKRRLLEFKSTLGDMGALFREYEDVDGFRRMVNIHLAQELMTLEKSDEVRRLHDLVNEQQRTIVKQEHTLQEQQETINRLVIYSMAEYLFRHLRKMYDGKRGKGKYLFRNDEPMRHDLRFLRDHGYIGFIDIGGLRDGQNLVDCVELTPVGNFYVELRRGPI